MTKQEDIMEALSEGCDIYCGKCGKKATVEGRDYGHGLTEFWGSSSGHSDFCLESQCCDSEDLRLEPIVDEDEVEE